MSLVEWLGRFSDRCPAGFSLEHQHPQLCQCQTAGWLTDSVANSHSPRGLKAQGIASTEAAADPDLRAMVDEEIRRAAATGRVFSANDFRDQLPDDVGPLMGARFLAACKAGAIVHVGYTQSTKASTHAHDVKTWRAA